MDVTDHPRGIEMLLVEREASGFGRRAFIAGSAGAIAGATLLAAPGSPVEAAGVEPGSSYFVPVDPQRFCDTRRGFGFQRLNGNTIRVPIGGVRSVPKGAVAVALDADRRQSLRRQLAQRVPLGTPWPGTASSNSEFYGQAVANLVTVKLGVGGAIDVRSMAASHVVADVTGYYVSASEPTAAGRLETFDPFRILDTRKTGKPRARQTVAVNVNGRVPADALAVVVNVTAVETEGGGFVTAYPLGQTLPLASSLNYGPGEIRGAAAMIKLGTVPGKLGFNLYTMARSHLVVDVVGYITGPSLSRLR